MVPCRPFRLVEHRNTTQEYPATVIDTLFDLWSFQP